MDEEIPLSQWQAFKRESKSGKAGHEQQQPEMIQVEEEDSDEEYSVTENFQQHQQAAYQPFSQIIEQAKIVNRESEWEEMVEEPNSGDEITLAVEQLMWDQDF